MYTLTRITDIPGSALHVMVDAPDPDSPDAGMTVGGSFHFEPAGQDGDTATVTDHAAAIIMGDPSLAKHFDCTPPWPSKAKGLAAPGLDGPVTKKVMLPGPDLKR